MSPLSELENNIHTCTTCREEYNLKNVIKHYPVISFGDPKGKQVLVVGLNPSTREYEDGFLLSSKAPLVRHRSQLTYFDSGHYTFFDKVAQFFGGDAKEALGWQKTPWEKVGFTDLTKCSTRRNKGQWSALKPSQR